MCDLEEMYHENSKNDIDDELLISLVKINPMLYDKKNRDFKDSKLNADTWLALSIGITASMIIKKLELNRLWFYHLVRQ